MDKKDNKICGKCLLCICTNAGCECSLTDNDVDYNQQAGIDYLEDGSDD